MYPILFEIGPLTIYTYGFMLAMAFCAGMALAMRRAPDYGIPVDDILNLSIITISAAIVGSRLLYVIIHWPDFVDAPWRIFMAYEGGLVFFGGLIGVMATGMPYMYKRGISLSAVLDCCAPALGAGHSLGRLGCFLNGCCYGRPTDAFTGVIFPSLGDNIARHPTQLYESAYTLALALLLLWLDRHWGGGRKRQNMQRRGARRRRRAVGSSGSSWNGSLFALYLLLYSSGRTIIELFRDDLRGGLGIFSTSQLISMFIIPLSIAYIVFAGNRANADHR